MNDEDDENSGHVALCYLLYDKNDHITLTFSFHKWLNDWLI